MSEHSLQREGFGAATAKAVVPAKQIQPLPGRWLWEERTGQEAAAKPTLLAGEGDREHCGDSPVFCFLD